MGGGRGTRLYPLTKLRCKPAVPLAGKYRLVDIPISNCINSGYNKIYLFHPKIRQIRNLHTIHTASNIIERLILDSPMVLSIKIIGCS